MTIKKFKTFEQAENDLIVTEPDENYYNKISELFQFGEQILKNRNIPHGIFKYKTFEEAEKAKIEWIKASF